MPVPLGILLRFRRGEVTTIHPVLTEESRLRQLLQPFEIYLTTTQAAQTLAYLQVLFRWNEKINLTAIRDEEKTVTRHFGESLFVARPSPSHGICFTPGSGAGFPGLALKIVAPDLSVTLLEPVTKKRSFP